MINAVDKSKFCGTTIIKKEGGDILDKEITKAVNHSTMGLSNTRMNGYSLVVVSDVFEKEEQNFLKSLRGKSIEYVNSTKVLNWKNLSRDNLIKLIENIAKANLL